MVCPLNHSFGVIRRRCAESALIIDNIKERAAFLAEMSCSRTISDRMRIPRVYGAILGSSKRRRIVLWGWRPILRDDSAN